MNTTRREFLTRGASGAVGALFLDSLLAEQAEAASQIRFRLASEQFGLDCAASRRVGLDGIEIGVDGPAPRLAIADPAVRRRYKESVKEAGLAVSSLVMHFLCDYPLHSEPDAPAWLEQAIDAAADLGATSILLPFFGKADVKAGPGFKTEKLKTTEVRMLAKRLNAAAPRAATAGVTLGIECTLSAAQYTELLGHMERKGFGVYYDIGNALVGEMDIADDILTLKDRICCFHFKDGDGYLGEGKIAMTDVAKAIRAIDYRGWIVLETPCPSRNPEADYKRNVQYVRKLMA